MVFSSTLLVHVRTDVEFLSRSPSKHSPFHLGFPLVLSNSSPPPWFPHPFQPTLAPRGSIRLLLSPLSIKGLPCIEISCNLALSAAPSAETTHLQHTNPSLIHQPSTLHRNDPPHQQRPLSSMLACQKLRSLQSSCPAFSALPCHRSSKQLIPRP